MEDLARAVKQFNEERDWEKFHTPKNLAMALTIEASELAEIFLWLTPEESEHLSPEALARASEEIGDVMLYLLNLAERLGIDPLEAARKKLEMNGEKYPAARVRGKALKYTEY
ncbi:MAG: nucleotide pyrophosphohydrolase [Anaerolineae bacterium]|nr:nucleotide pyrophosphohydrolase [Anaerolineae bacterium]